MPAFRKDLQYVKFCAYGFLKNLRLFDAFLIVFFLAQGLNYTDIGILYALREITKAVLEVPSGIAADTYGRKTTLLFSFVCYNTSFITFYFAESTLVLGVAMFLFGVADSFRSGSHKGMIMDYLRNNGWHDQKVAYYGRTRAWSQTGSAISALLAGGIVFFEEDFRLIFLLSVIPYLLNFFNVASYPSELNQSHKPNQQGPSMGFTFRSFAPVIRRPDVLAVLHSSAVHSAYTKAIKDYLQVIVLIVMSALILSIQNSIDKTMTAESVIGLLLAFVYFVLYLLTAWASRSAGWLAGLKVRGLPLITLVIGLVAGLASGLLGIMGWWWPALGAFVVIYLVENLRKPLLIGVVANQVPRELLASVLSAQSLWKTILTSLIAVGFGVLGDTLGLGEALAITSGALLVVTLGLEVVGRLRQPE